MVELVGTRKALSKGRLLQMLTQQRETIEALKRSLSQRRNPAGNVLTRATVDELMAELETRPRAEVEDYIARNKPTGVIV